MRVRLERVSPSTAFHPKAWIWVSIVIAAASNSVVVKIQQLGACDLTAHGVNPISYCNLPFAGSVVAFGALLFLRPRAVSAVNLPPLTRWLRMTTFIVASLAGGEVDCLRGISGRPPSAALHPIIR